MTLATFALLAMSRSTPTALPPYKNPKLPIETRVEDLLKRMTLEEKLNQLRCDQTLWEKTIETTGFGQTLDILRPLESLTAAKLANEVQRRSLKNRLQIPLVIHDEALHGLIGNGTTSFPQSIAMAATWNPELVGKSAAAVAEETRARGVRHVLSPVINVIRDARWGRVEETYGEDPLLTSRMGVAFVRAFETRGVATNPKHYVVNAGDGGHDSFPIDISERALREIYLPPFEAVVKEAGASTLMCSYNSVNGRAMAANKWLLTDILRGEWGFKGWVASDYGAVEGIQFSHRHTATAKDTAAAALNAGMDSEWPGTGDIWGKGLDDAVREGLISRKTVDESVRRVLRIKFKTGMFEDPWADEKNVLNIVQSPAHRNVALEAARQAMTLLKNDGGTLPFKKSIQSIAVLGPNAKDGMPLGGYSGSNIPTVSVVDGLRAKLGPAVRVEWAQGSRFSEEDGFPPIQGSVFRDLRGEYFDNRDLQGTPKLVRNDLQLAFNWNSGSPDPVLPNDNFSARWTGRIVPEKSGEYIVSLRADDGVRLWLDDKLVINDWTEHSARASNTRIRVEAGVPIKLRLEYYEQGGEASMQLGWGQADTKSPEIEQAVELAKKSDVTVIVAGIVEGEAQDRAYLDLPGTQEELIQRVSELGKPFVVVLLAGSPVTMEKWIDKTPALLNAWYPGQEGGTAIAETLFGDVNPGGKLPITFPRHVSQCPIYYNGAPSGRGYDYVNLTGKPQFPFGYGLSYTTFEYSNLKLGQKSLKKGQPLQVSFEIKNTGSVIGDEVPQLYLHQTVSSIVRPMKELKEFIRIRLAPGERRIVTFTLPPDTFAIWDAKMKRTIESAPFDIMIGTSSDDIRLRETVEIK